MAKKCYELTIPEQEIAKSDLLYALTQDALLLSLLDKKTINLWQYEQCQMKLHIPFTQTL